MKPVKKLLTLISLLLSLFSAAQVAPLDVSVQLLPPYSICLPDLAAPGSDRLRIQVVQRDLMTASYDFFLVLEVEHQGRMLMRTAIRHRPVVNITPGRILVLSGAVVAPYLEEQNLDFFGYSRDLYRRTQTIPEGLVTIKATAYDYYRPTQRVSRTAQTSAWLAKADPPLLQTPPDRQQVAALNDLYPVVFSWLPRNMASPNSALQTTYQLELFEVMAEGDSPDRVARSQPPIYERELMQTSYPYGAADPRLTLGKTYAWRVKAADRSGRDLFANSGYSPVFSFTYGYDPAVAPLPPVTGVQVATKANTATLTWQGHPDHRYYVVELKCESCSDWITADSTDQRRALLAPLAYGVEYQALITAHNDRRRSPATELVSFTCTAPPSVPCDEADGETAPPLDYSAPLLHTLPYSLEVTDKKAIRYTIKGSELNPDGSFSGGAVMYINLGQPGGIPVRVAFKNLRVNQLLQVTAGTFHFVTAAGGMAESGNDKYFHSDKVGTGKGTTTADTTVDFVINPNSTVNVVASTDSTTTYLIEDEKGEMHEVTVAKKEGDIYTMNENKDEKVYAAEMGAINEENNTTQLSNNKTVDNEVEIKKVEDLVMLLQQRIRKYLKNTTEKYPKMAFENEKVLPPITFFDPNDGGGGSYRNGKLHIGTKNFKEKSSDEDVMATIYHEYMHYLTWQFGDRYRMADLEKGEIYQKRVLCFEKRMQKEEEFLQKAYQSFIDVKMKTTDINILMPYADYPLLYTELNEEQKREVGTYMKDSNLKPEITCIPYKYLPSNYLKDEINAHTETLNANSKKVFKMSDGKINFYHREINRYTNRYNKSKMYEVNNNLNSEGYEN